MHEGQCIGVIVCRLDHHRNQRLRGYIAMLAVSSAFRKNKIGSSSTSTCTMKPTLPYSGISLVKKAIQRMQAQKADEVRLLYCTSFFPIDIGLCILVSDPFRRHAASIPPHYACSQTKVVLEAEVTNSAALALYEQLGFVRDKRLYRYYLTGVDAYRLKLWLT